MTDESTHTERVTSVSDLSRGDRVRVGYKGVVRQNRIETVGEVQHVFSDPDAVRVLVNIEMDRQLHVTLSTSGQNTVESSVLGESPSLAGDCAWIEVIDDDAEEVGDDA